MITVNSAASFAPYSIKTGEYPTPAVLNRPVLGLLNNDIVLETAAQMLARSGGARYVSNTTKLLCHFDETTKDCIGGILDASEAAGARSAGVTKDNMFSGVFIAQDSATNVIPASVDSSLCSLVGWTVSGTKAGTVSVVPGANGLSINNTSLLASYALYSSVYAPGTLAITSNKYPLVGQTTTSVSIRLSTEANLQSKGITVQFTLNFYSSSNSLVGTASKSVKSNEYDGTLSLSNITVPVGTTQANVVITITYANLQTSPVPSVADLTIKNVMHCTGSICHTYASTTLAACSAQYDNVIDGSTDFSVFAWAYISSEQVNNYNLTYGPLFISAPTIAQGSFGLRHVLADKGLYKFAVSTSSTVRGNTFVIPASDYNTYRPCMLRKRLVAGVVEVSALLLCSDGTLLSSTLLGTTMSAPYYNLVIGKDPKESVVPSYSNSGITEVRYDAEWLNDVQFTMLALNQGTFLTGSEDTVFDQSVNVNMLKNPDGKLGLNFWSNVPTGFNSLTSSTQGTGFSWAGVGTTADVLSEAISVNPLSAICLSGKVKSNSGSTGVLGLKIMFYSNIQGTTYISSSSTAAAVNSDNLCIVKTVVPANALSAKVSMQIGAATSTGVSWSQLKLENDTDTTNFSNDATPAYAVYAS